ncbi:hypothetical protein GN958_ATG15231 [Phytophthora infestans]|uniref:BZIP domain-containing protein n=1 Tax=Phytophthora infestans TaxID=4787 RepID=A0A8S9U7L8_PHYIN|nr:hypothetical protein GN958_ATG15231 [Phytophthora infestans]
MQASTSTLDPPNLQKLSGNVIASVVQRSRAYYVQSQSVCEQSDMTTDRSPPASTAGTSAVKPTSTRAVRSARQSGDRKMADIGSYRRQCRERRRKYQERYRARQRQMIEDLEACNLKLQREIEGQRRKRNTLVLFVSTRSVWHVAVDYFRLFKRELLTANEPHVMTFLRATMAQDLDAGSVHGLHALVTNWAVFTELFQEVHIQLRGLEQVADATLVATTTTSITFTSRSLSNLLPGLTSSRADPSNDRKRSRIVCRLQGQLLVMYGSVLSRWDGTINRVVSLITQVDMVSPLLQLLDNLEDVSLVFRHARISPECNLIVGSASIGTIDRVN